MIKNVVVRMVDLGNYYNYQPKYMRNAATVPLHYFFSTQINVTRFLKFRKEKLPLQNEACNSSERERRHQSEQ